MGPGDGMMIGAFPLIEIVPLFVLGYMLLRAPVNLVVGAERPGLRRYVTVAAALVACRLLLSLPG